MDSVVANIHLVDFGWPGWGSISWPLTCEVGASPIAPILSLVRPTLATRLRLRFHFRLRMRGRNTYASPVLGYLRVSQRTDAPITNRSWSWSRSGFKPRPLHQWAMHAISYQFCWLLSNNENNKWTPLLQCKVHPHTLQAYANMFPACLGFYILATAKSIWGWDLSGCTILISPTWHDLKPWSRDVIMLVGWLLEFYIRATSKVIPYKMSTDVWQCAFMVTL